MSWLKRPSVDALLGAALLLGTLAVYLPSLGNGTVWDDDVLVTSNEALRSAAGLSRIWLEPRALPQYYPVTISSFWAEYRLWGLDPAGYHLSNVVLHALCAVLFWLLLRRLAVPGAWLAAALFAVHPVQVESVAWISERKNLLSGALALAALLAYWDGSAKRRALALGLFILALLSKSVVCTLPIVVALLLWSRERRFGMKELAPLVGALIVGAAAGAGTAWLEVRRAGASGRDWDLSFLQRCLIAGRALWFYAGKLLWPHPLIFSYPRWNVDAASWAQYVWPLAAVVVLAVLWRRRRAMRGAFAAVLIYVVTLSPALGFFNVYPMRFSFVADHFLYTASLPLFALFAAGLSTRLEGASLKAVSAVLLSVLAVSTWRGQARFANAETLWRDTLEKNPESWLALDHLARRDFLVGDFDAAAREYAESLRLKPGHYEAVNSLGAALASEGRVEEAIPYFQAALKADPGDVSVRRNLETAMATLATMRGKRGLAPGSAQPEPDPKSRGR